MIFVTWYVMIFGLMGFEGEGPPKSADSQSFVTSYTIASDESYLDWGYGVIFTYSVLGLAPNLLEGKM